MSQLSEVDRQQLKDSLDELIAFSAETPENALYSILIQILKCYIRCGYAAGVVGTLASPSECDPVIKDAVDALSRPFENAIEEVLDFYISSLVWSTLCPTSVMSVSRTIGVLQRVTQSLGHREYWGIEGIRYGRAIGILRCVELEFYKRATTVVDTAFALREATHDIRYQQSRGSNDNSAESGYRA